MNVKDETKKMVEAERNRSLRHIIEVMDKQTSSVRLAIDKAHDVAYWRGRAEEGQEWLANLARNFCNDYYDLRVAAAPEDENED